MQRSRLNRPVWSIRANGFTLIEVLVVMIIMGLVTGILFQAIERAYQLQERFGTELFSVQEGQMATDWYRQSVQGLRPDYPDGQNLFQGTASAFSGLSDNALGSFYGAPTSISWRIRKSLNSGATDLVYIDNGRETPILSWQGSNAHFIYIDALQAPHETWPPPLGPWPQLPIQIQLIARDGADTAIIISTPMSTAAPVSRIKDLL